MNQKKSLLKLKKASNAAQKKEYITSIRLCKEMIKKTPENVSAQKLLATNFIALKRYDEVETTLKRVINLVSEQESYPLRHLLGCNYISQQDYHLALPILEEVFNHSGDSKVLLDIALVHYELGNYEAARDIYLKLIELEPNNHQAKFNLYPILLHFKDYKNAWVCFHSRLERQEIKDQVHWFAPQWQGESLTDKNILIYPEQGIGDNLACTGGIFEAIKEARKVYIVCDKRLKSLYESNFPSATILSYADVNRAQSINAEIDVQILSGSLSYLYLLSEPAFMEQQYLTIANELIAVKENLLSKKKLRIGLSWFHGRVNDGNKHSMSLEKLLPMLKIEGVEWVNLQFGEWQKEVSAIKAKHDISITHLDDSAASGDFEHYGALIKSLDLVISASNAALMFASRLGVNSWVFLPGIAPSQASKSVGVSSILQNNREFYQGEGKGWDAVVERFCDEIKLLS